MKGIWNHMRAVDLLQGLPGIDGARIGVIGHSLGAHNALFLAAFDDRVAACVSSCGFTRFTWNDNEGRGDPGNLTDWSHKGYMPRIASDFACRAENMPFDFPDVLGAIAPRPLFVNAPMGDFFQYQGVDECAERVAPLYAGRDGAFVVRHPEGGHDFPLPVRREAYAWLEQSLGA
jgi:pimeloyl-ACP methyl ester carboxylesterase